MLMQQKTLTFADVNLKMKADSWTFEGYASKFNGLDSYGDTILPGAFADTLAKNGMPKMFFNHEWTMPIGKWHVEEDSTGLFAKGELTQNMMASSDVRAGLLHGTIDGLSIGGFLQKDDYETKDGVRIIKKWSKLVEISPVVFPADGAARIDLASVKHIDFEALLPECATERDIERLLRDSGLGKWEAMALVSRAKAIFAGGMPAVDDEAKKMAALSARLQSLATATATK